MTPPTEDNHLLRIGLAQIAPVWLDRERTIQLLPAEIHFCRVRSRRLGTSMDCVQWRQRVALPSIWERWSALPTVARTASIVP